MSIVKIDDVEVKMRPGVKIPDKIQVGEIVYIRMDCDTPEKLNEFLRLYEYFVAHDINTIPGGGW